MIKLKWRTLNLYGKMLCCLKYFQGLTWSNHLWGKKASKRLLTVKAFSCLSPSIFLSTPEVLSVSSLKKKKKHSFWGNQQISDFSYICKIFQKPQEIHWLAMRHAQQTTSTHMWKQAHANTNTHASNYSVNIGINHLTIHIMHNYNV